MRLILATMLAGGLILPAAAQDWIARYNGPAGDEDIAKGLAAGDSGCVYVTGTSWSSTTGNDIATVKYGPAGDTRWTMRFDGQAHGSDEAGGIAAGAGRVAVTGASADASSFSDMITCCYAGDGSALWRDTCNGPAGGNDCGLALAIDAAGNVYVAGYQTGDTTGWDMVTVKYSSQGVRQWVSRYATTDEDYGIAIAVDPNGNCYVAGNSGSPYTLSWDYVTVKYDAAGQEQWVRRYNGPADEQDEVRALGLDGDGNVVVAGFSTTSGTGLDFTTIKYRANGDTAWLRRYNGPANGSDQALALAVTTAGDIYVTGASPDAASDMDYATVKYGPDGSELWVRRYDGPVHGFDEARAVVVDGSGVYVTGASTGDGTRADYVTVKYDLDGNQAWTKRYDGPASRMDEAVAIVVGSDGRPVVTGGSAGSGTGTDYATVCYAASGVEEYGQQPATPRSGMATVVRGALRLDLQHGLVGGRAMLLDAAGRRVLELRTGANDISELAPGVYFVSLGRDAAVTRVLLAR